MSPAAPSNRPTEVRVALRPLGRLGEFVGPERFARARDELREAAQVLRGRVVWHVNSTARGGGVAEMMGPLIGYARDAGADARWLVISGTPAFFTITKRLHNLLHGNPGDGGPLGPDHRRVYEHVLRHNAVELQAVVRPDDVVVLHDPQTAGLIPALRRRGAVVVWRCHIGSARHDDPLVSEAWAFLAPYLDSAHATVFSLEDYVPDCCRGGPVAIIRPSIDPLSAKNQDLSPGTVRSILVQTGLIEGPPGPEPPTFVREEGGPGRVDRGADILRVGRAPRAEIPLVVQISRWDRLKDHIGVMEGFARLDDGARLVLAGPAVTSVADDPDGPEVLSEVTRAWRALPHDTRRRVQLVALPMVDPQENAAIVNALQRHAAVVVQKSLEEGFGLTVTEAMWKGRPVIASAVGGIAAQIENGRNGLLVDDPRDSAAFASALGGLLADPGLRDRIGAAGRERVRGDFLVLRQLLDYAHLIARLVDGRDPHGAAITPAGLAAR